MSALSVVHAQALWMFMYNELSYYQRITIIAILSTCTTGPY